MTPAQYAGGAFVTAVKTSENIQYCIMFGMLNMQGAVQ